jgi:hypothetical protein
MCPFPPRVPMVDGPFPPRRHRWPTSSCARQSRKSRCASRLPAKTWMFTPFRGTTSIRKVDMVRAIVYFFLGIVVLGTIATPGLGAVALLAAPLLGLGFLWRVALTVSTHGRPLDTVVQTRRSQLLGPGGPDDSFAVSPRDEVEYLPAASPARASVSARNGNGLARGASVPRPRLSQPRVHPLGESSVQEGVG